MLLDIYHFCQHTKNIFFICIYLIYTALNYKRISSNFLILSNTYHVVCSQQMHMPTRNNWIQEWGGRRNSYYVSYKSFTTASSDNDVEHKSSFQLISIYLQSLITVFSSNYFLWMNTVLGREQNLQQLW